MAAGSRVFELEAGGVVLANPATFSLTDTEVARVAKGLTAGRSKNLSLDPETGALRGVSGEAAVDPEVCGIMRRYAVWARTFLDDVAPEYGPRLQIGRTSMRTRDASAPAMSARKDDRRLHADAFPSSPTGGARILRVFMNFNPDGQPRVWRVGEPFETYATRWVRRVRRPWRGEAWLFQRMGLTRTRRTPYDALMLGLHDHAKLDKAYQRASPHREMSFPAGSSWVLFTDGVIHAAVSGRYALEQTFYLPIEAMVDPDASPLRVLEKLTGRHLV